MSKPDPQFGVALSTSEVNPALEVSAIYGVTPANKYIPIAVDNDGKLSIGSVTITGPVTISDVVIKGVDPDNGNTSHDVAVTNLGGGSAYSLRTSLYNGSNELTINPDGSILVELTSGSIEIGTVDQGTPASIANAWPTKLTDGTHTVVVNSDGSINADISSSGSIPVTIDHNLDSVAIYGTDGTMDQFIKTDSSGNLQVSLVGSSSVSINNFPAVQPISGTVTTTPPANASSNITEIGGVALSLGQKVSASSIPVVISSDQSAIAVTGTITTSPNVNVHDGSGNSISSSGGSLNVDVTNTVAVSGTVAATQSGVWSTGRTWTLASGTDSVASLQSGTWNITNISGTISLPSGAATETTLLAIKADTDKFTFASTRLLVDGSGVTQPISGTVSISGTVPVSGTVNQGTPNTLTNAWPVELSDGTNLLGTSSHPVRIDPTGTTTQPVNVLSLVTSTDNIGSGTITTLNGSVVALTNGCSTVVFNVTGTFTATLALQGSNGDGTYHAIAGVNVGLGSFSSAPVSGGTYSVPCGGLASVRITSTAYTSGTINISWNAGAGQDYINQGVPCNINSAWPIKVTDGTNVTTIKAASTAALTTDTSQVVAISPNSPLPIGTNVIGHVIADSGSTTTVTGNVTVVQSIGSSLHVDVDNFPSTQPISGTVSISGSVAVTGTFFQATQPISASSLPLPTGASTETTLSALNTKVTTTANGIKVDGSAVTQPISGSISVSNFPATQPISGTVAVTQSTSPWVISGAVTQASGPWTSNVTQISGSAIAIAASGIAKIGVTDGSGNAVTSTVDGSQRGLDNNIVNIQDNMGTGTITALNATVIALTNGSSVVNFQVTGTWSATLTIQGTVDGSTWNTIVGDVDITDTIESTITANTFVSVACGGFQQVRLIATAFTSGTVNIAWESSIGSSLSEVYNTNPASLMASVVQFPSTKATFGIGVGPITPAATPTDIVTISGSATTVVRVLSVEIFMTATALADFRFLLIKRSSANTGGTSTTPTIVPFDSNNTATAVIRQYTANPTAVGTAIGTLAVNDLLVGGTTTVTGAQLGYKFDLTYAGLSSGLILRGTTQFLAINGNSAALPLGSSITGVNIVWIEE